VRTFSSAALGLWLSVSGTALGQSAAPALPVEPGALKLSQAPAVSANQQLANTIGAQLRQNANLRGYRIDVSVASGVAELHGVVADAAQRDEAVRTAQAVPGVERVRDHLTLTQSSGVMPVQAKQPPMPVPPLAPVPPLPPAAGPLGGPGAMPPPPAPIYAANPNVPNPALQPPPLPPYAWPTYAPYNNYSRVAYPTKYPAEAWPFIGPMHPFPRVPLGWRAVTLRWEDGHWWYGRTATGHDWWRIRYW
jgi:hypothetical protein